MIPTYFVPCIDVSTGYMTAPWYEWFRAANAQVVTLGGASTSLPAHFVALADEDGRASDMWRQYFWSFTTQAGNATSSVFSLPSDVVPLVVGAGFSFYWYQVFNQANTLIFP
jgi:hypothetical protein